MEIPVHLQLSPADQADLAAALGCEPDELPARLACYFSAAAREYAEMFLGRRAFTRGADLREYRLYLLIEHAFDHTIPSEQQVTQLFQTTQAESRALIRSVMSKYQVQLKTAIHNSLARVLASAVQAEDGGPYIAAVNCQSLVDELNNILREIDGALPSIRKERGSISTYQIPVSSYQRLKKRLRIR